MLFYELCLVAWYWFDMTSGLIMAHFKGALFSEAGSVCHEILPFADKRCQYQTGVFHRMIKIHDLQAVLEIQFAHVFQSVSPVEQ